MAKNEIPYPRGGARLGGLTLTVLLAVIFCACTPNRTVEPPRQAAFQELFGEQKETHLVGTKESPLFTTGVPLFTEDRVYFPDYMGHKVLIYDQAGAFITEWGGQGQAPGEFQMPYSVAADRDGNIYVNDRGNQRVQIFEPSGALIQTVSTPGQNEHHYVSAEGESEMIRALGVARCGAKPCLIQDFDSETGKRKRTFAEVDEENTYLSSWVATHDAEGRLFLANVLTPPIEVYSRKRKRERVIDLASPSMVSVDVTQLSDNPYEKIKWFKAVPGK